MFDLSGKTAVVTGAGSGIGAAIARRFGAAGATVYVVDRDADSGSTVAQEVTAAGPGRGVFLTGDVADGASVASVAAQVLEQSGGVCDVLVNNAGIGHVGNALTTTPADLERLWGVNVQGVLLMSQAFLPAMIARKSGSIVNLASIGGIVGIRDRLGYCATKFAVVGLTKCMALDHASDNIRVNCLCPGRVETPFVQARLAEYADPEAARVAMTNTQALKRMAAPEEIASAAHYLASDEAAFVTGSSLIIDAGWSAGK